jgi:hypothetical protein
MMLDFFARAVIKAVSQQAVHLSKLHKTSK